MSFINKKYSIAIFVLLVFISSSLLIYTSYKTGTLTITQEEYNTYYLGLFVHASFYNIMLGLLAFVVNIYIFRLFNHNIVDLPAFYNLVILRGIATTLYSVILLVIGLKVGIVFNIISFINPLLFLVYYLFIKYYTFRGYNQKQLIRYIACIYLANILFNILATNLF